MCPLAGWIFDRTPSTSVCLLAQAISTTTFSILPTPFLLIMLRSLSRAASTGAGARSSLPAPLSRLSRGIAMSSVSRAAAAMTVPEAASDPGAHLRGMKASTKAAKIVPTSPTVQDGRERSAIFGRYPTRKKINFKAGRERKFDPKAEWRLDPICKPPLVSPLFLSGNTDLQR